ncbi:hypothetical protein [Lacipirellula parvula]|uniref:Uncharacterized protein n=1 Tax=Lacipirellula parvula TaxID=2650471 RepID=A0A5K7X274_9BACT|nr:hypothetical protein [Lacipirellula parvula]BBO30435.1 hypothetical protein PLANPX_0047 [Lacipirellula parvula]
MPRPAPEPELDPVGGVSDADLILHAALVWTAASASETPPTTIILRQ